MSDVDSKEIEQYEVSKQQKELWSVELDILKKVDEVCKKYNIKYFADYGTLLGAVRHKGFIPWDDDIDVTMLADDYFRFCEIAREEFKYPFFFQSWETEEGFWPYHVKIRRTDTTGATFREAKNKVKWNRGIFLDIFPLYNVYGDTKRYQFFARRIRCRQMILNHITERNNIDKVKTLRYRLFTPITYLMDYSSLCKNYIRTCVNETRGKKTGYVCYPGSLVLEESQIAKSDWYESTVMLPFMDMMIPAPRGWDERLSKIYGDYMIPVRGGATHTGLIYSTSIPYEINTEISH